MKPSAFCYSVSHLSFIIYHLTFSAALLSFIIYYLTFSAAPCAAANLQLELYQISHIDLDDGLPHNNVNQMFADSKGFVWISTYGGGVVRYDGYSFRRFPFGSGNEEEPQVNSVACKAITEDTHHRLWIAYDEYTTVVDLHTMKPVVPQYGNTDISRQLRKPSTKVYCDSKGAVWQITTDSIFRYEFNQQGAVAAISSCRYQNNTPDIAIADIDRNGSVWCAVDYGIYRLLPDKDKLLKREIDPSLRTLQHLFVTAMLKRENTVWISTNNGLFSYHLYSRSLQSYHHTDNEGSLPHNFTTSLALSTAGKLLVGTLRGIAVLNSDEQTFLSWSSNNTHSPLPSDFIHCMTYINGQLWVGTETAGIVKISPRPLILSNFTPPVSVINHLSPVNAMYADATGTLWVGSVDGGMSRRDSEGNVLHWNTHNSLLSHNTVSALTPDNQGYLWIGTWGGGLNVTSLSGHPSINPVQLPEPFRSQCSYIGALAYDKHTHNLWVGCNEGIFVYNTLTRKMAVPFEGNQQIRGCIGAHIDRHGQLWMGCITGVCVVDLKKGPNQKGYYHYRRLRNKLDQPQSNITDKITCFCETRNGTLWLGSNGYGLYRRSVDPKTGKELFTVLTTDHGLANNAVKGIVEDEQERLWITTDNGLSVYNPRTRTFNNYGRTDGLLSNQFYYNSAIAGPEGNIYLGSMLGVTQIKGENHAEQTPHLTFTRLTVDNQEAMAGSGYLDADISEASTIRIHEAVKSLAIEFSSLCYTGENHGHYRYRMKGFEKEWNTLKPGEHAARYTNLPPGRYTFEVSFTTGENDKKENTISIEVVVKPYFWKTWWFILLLALALAGLTVWLYQLQARWLRRNEAEKLIAPVMRILEEEETPDMLQQRIKNMLDNHQHVKQSVHRSTEETKHQNTDEQKSFLERTTAIMEQNYMNSDFGISELAEALGMSKSLLSKKLNADTGLSSGQFIRNYRLNVARKLLLENSANRNISEIAFKVGFNDPKYFTRCFSRHYGQSPSTYTEEGKSG